MCSAGGTATPPSSAHVRRHPAQPLPSTRGDLAGTKHVTERCHLTQRSHPAPSGFLPSSIGATAITRPNGVSEVVSNHNLSVTSMKP